MIPPRHRHCSVFGSFSYQPPSTRDAQCARWWWHTPHDLIDKIDPANLARDTRSSRASSGRCWRNELLPLDYSAQIAALAAEIERLRSGLAGRFPFDALVADAADLATAYAEFRAAAQDAAAKSRALMRLSRIVVPLDYTRGDRFVHDAALPLPPWSVLDPCAGWPRRRAAVTTSASPRSTPSAPATASPHIGASPPRACLPGLMMRIRPMFRIRPTNLSAFAAWLRKPSFSSAQARRRSPRKN